MFQCSKTLTVINRITDGRTDKTRYFCHVFDGCGWFADHSIQAERGGTAAADVVKVRIPAEAAPGFVPPAQWAALDDDARATAWTLDSATVVVLGAVDAVADAAALAAISRQYETASVRRWHDHRQTVFPHFYVGGGDRGIS